TPSSSLRWVQSTLSSKENKRRLPRWEAVRRWANSLFFSQTNGSLPLRPVSARSLYAYLLISWRSCLQTGPPPCFFSTETPAHFSPSMFENWPANAIAVTSSWLPPSRRNFSQLPIRLKSLHRIGDRPRRAWSSISHRTLVHRSCQILRDSHL